MAKGRRTAAQRQADAARAVVKRQRRKKGIMIVRLPLDDTWAPELLIASGCLDEDRTEDRKALALGVLLLLAKLDRDRLEKDAKAARVPHDSGPWEELINSLRIV